MLKKFIVNKDYHDSRFDRWFKHNILNVPQSLIEKLIRKKKIKINSKKIQTNYRVKLNDIIEIYGIDNLKKKDQPKKFKYKATKQDENKYSK